MRLIRVSDFGIGMFSKSYYNVSDINLLIIKQLYTRLQNTYDNIISFFNLNYDLTTLLKIITNGIIKCE